MPPRASVIVVAPNGYSSLPYISSASTMIPLSFWYIDSGIMAAGYVLIFTVWVRCLTVLIYVF
ncbi:hypothetical protein BDR03DRAFT_941282 [Suillus americanus]|nr:hypothetical protein BDR03DRAFT_941282 [Suillus americanus]